MDDEGKVSSEEARSAANGSADARLCFGESCRQVLSSARGDKKANDLDDNLDGSVFVILLPTDSCII